jgi:hypothetical protein
MATSNTLTGLIPVIFDAMDVVANEPAGLSKAVARDVSAEMAAKGQTVRSPVAPPATLEEITPGATPAASGGQTFAYKDIMLSKAYAVPILWSGEEQKSVAGHYNTMFADQVKQAFRVFRNTIDSDLSELYAKASRACGTAGSPPFDTAGGFSDFANALKILEENGAMGDLQMVLGSAAIANIRAKQSVLFKVNESGTSDLLRNGIIGSVQGLNIRQSAQIGSHTKGTGASYVLDGAVAIGDTTVSIKTGTGTVLAGDVIVIEDDPNKYVVTSGVTAVGDIVIGAPGIKQVSATGKTVTLQANHVSNMFFDRQAIQLATRIPAVPEGGDSADDRMTVADPITGIVYDISMYRQYKQIKIEIGLVWGFQVIKPEFLGILLG